MIRWFVIVLAAVGLVLGSLIGSAYAQEATLVQETFEGYTSFPAQDPLFDFVNPGIPKLSEGAQAIWYGGRFEIPDGGPIDSDLAVQRFGGLLSANNSHVGRFEDDAGLLLHLNTTAYTDVKLNFDYRTFLADSTDRLVAGYFTGNLNLGPCTGAGEPGCYRDFVAQDFGGSQSAAEQWWANQWTQIVRDQGDAWKSITDYSLPANQSSVWVAFWLDNGQGDFGKLDNVKVTATVAPEPVGGFLLLAGGALLAGRRARRMRSGRTTS